MMRVRPSRVSIPMLGISLIRKCGPEKDHCFRSWLVASQRPFLVPIAKTKLSEAFMNPMQPLGRRGCNGFGPHGLGWIRLPGPGLGPDPHTVFGGAVIGGAGLRGT